MIGRLMKTNLVIGVRSYVYPLYLLVALAYGLMLLAFPEQYLPAVVPISSSLSPASSASCSSGQRYSLRRRTG